MGKALCEAEPAARARFDEADAILGRSLSSLCFDGPKEELDKTENTQPALFVCSAAAVDVLAEKGIKPDCVAGHSLGEYPALYAAQVLDFETGLKLVAKRGAAMAEAGQENPGAMAAIIGLDLGQVETLCVQASTDLLKAVVANVNSGQQIVISGHTEAIDKVCALAKKAGAKRALPLPVSCAAHSPLVESAAELLCRELQETILHEPACPFIPGRRPHPEEDAEAIRQELKHQITGQVRWVEVVEQLGKYGVTAALEVGPGKVLAGLTKRIDRSLQVLPAGEPADIQALLEALA